MRACTRLGLNCSFEPDKTTSVTGTSRYRVRFVNSQYTKLPRGEAEKNDVKTASTSPEQSRLHSVPNGASCAEPLNGNGNNIHVNTGGVGMPESMDSSRHRYTRDEPTVLPSATGSLRHDASFGVVQDPANIGVAVGLNAQLMSVQDAQVNLGHMPSFFDLDMNFDLLDEDWFPAPVPDTGGDGPLVDTTPRSSDVLDSEQEETAVVIGQEDNGLIQHYLNVMTGYAKIRYSGDENLYSQIFSDMALFYAPLYHCVMAWTALHLGQTKSEPDLVQKATERYSHAVSLMHRDQNVAHHFELSLITIWFALQFELLAASGIVPFCRHLEFTADLVDAHRRHQKAGGQAAPLGPIGSRVLVWLGAYDARASWIGGTGRLLQNLELFSSEYDFLNAAFPETRSNSNGQDTKPCLQDTKPCLRLNLDFDTVEGRIVHLHRREVAAPVTVWTTVQDELLSIQERLESDRTIASIVSSLSNPTRSLGGKITMKGFNCFLLLATFYSVVICYHRMLPPRVVNSIPKKLISAESAAKRIISITSTVCRLRPPSPQNIWPRILFLAGIETTDMVYQDWVVKTLADAEVWGANFGKTRVLLEHVIRIQGREGTRVDYLDVMKQTTGLFII
ncbi:hypothetical protein SLS62_005137 [Diatrype stigma]|uniref:Transcription factor domain-containing protein n=1 Tax=Diatrype stigma TaxID=117547 RepID=A0AAN9V3T8_9PEZI